MIRALRSVLAHCGRLAVGPRLVVSVDREYHPILWSVLALPARC